MLWRRNPRFIPPTTPWRAGSLAIVLLVAFAVGGAWLWPGDDTTPGGSIAGEEPVGEASPEQPTPRATTPPTESPLATATGTAPPTPRDDAAARTELRTIAANIHTTGDAEELTRYSRALETAPHGSLAEAAAAFATARRLVAAGDHSRAAAMLRSVLPGAPAAVAPYLFAELGTALEAAGDGAAAERARRDALARPETSGGLRVAVLRALVASAAGTPGDATALLAATTDPAARYDAARLLLRTGRTAEAHDALRRLIAASPGSSHALRALEELERQGAWVDPGAAGLAFYRHGMYARAIALLEPATNEAGLAPTDLAFRAFYLAAAYEDSDRPTEAVAWYDRAAAAAPGSTWAHRARYWAARILEGEGQAAAAFTRYLEGAAAGPGEFALEMVFRAGYLRWQAGDALGALIAWEAGPANDPRLQLWRAKALANLDDPAGRIAILETLAAGSPGYYRREATRLLGRPVADGFGPAMPDTSIAWDDLAGWAGATEVDPATAARIELLVLAGERGLAAAELRAAMDGAGPATLVALARLAAGHALWRNVIEVGWRLAAVPGAPAAVTRLTHPLGYVESLTNAAAAEGIDPLFLAALVRQESLWDADARSHADAWGLTQVIPATGAAIAAGLGREGFTPAQLLDPATSLRFGADYIATQLNRFGTPDGALAAYNAGPGAAARWQGAAGTARGIDFLEHIEYAETRRYVEVVLDAYETYLAEYR